MARKVRGSGGDSPADTAAYAKTLQRMRGLQAKARNAFVAGLDRTAVAERVIDEMARRQGQRLGPYFEWGLATEEFELRLSQALMQKPPQQSVDEFAQRFVDIWPRGMAALRVIPDERDPIANPPYSSNGMWPAYLKERK